MLNVNLLKAFDSNYIFMLQCDVTGQRAVVDPGDSEPVMSFLDEDALHNILITHHHYDHVGGVAKLCDIYNSDVICARCDEHRIPRATTTVVEGDEVMVGASKAKVLRLDGHTIGHIAYYFEQEKMLFCGDTLFSGGCGRLFEGSADDMFNSLVKLKGLPDDVAVYCAHEYTMDNFKFAVSVADGRCYQQALVQAEKVREQGLPTIPTTIGYERSHNIFMRAATVEAFAKLRKQKDSF